MRWENKAIAGRQLISDPVSEDKRDRGAHTCARMKQGSPLPPPASSPERRGKRQSSGGENRRVEEKKKKREREKAASKRPPSSIHPLSVSSGTVSKRWEHPLGPECVSFFPRARSLFRPPPFPENPFHMCRIKRSGVRACTRKQKRRGGIGGSDPTNPDNEPDCVRRRSATD